MGKIIAFVDIPKLEIEVAKAKKAVEDIVNSNAAEADKRDLVKATIDGLHVRIKTCFTHEL